MGKAQNKFWKRYEKIMPKPYKEKLLIKGEDKEKRVVDIGWHEFPLPEDYLSNLLPQGGDDGGEGDGSEGDFE